MAEQLRIPNVVVTGGRDFADGVRIDTDFRALEPFGLRRVAQGGDGIDKQFGGDRVPRVIKSADTLAWLAACGLRLEAPTYFVNCAVDEGDDRPRRYTGEDGKWPAAGPRRNRRMLLAEKPALVLAYPTPASKGTWSCIVEAWRLGIPSLIWLPWAANSGASRILAHALQERGVRLTEHTAVCGLRALRGDFGRDGHRVLVGDPELADRLPKELD